MNQTPDHRALLQADGQRFGALVSSREHVTRPPGGLDRAEISEAARELVERSTRAQGFPLRVTDREALARVAALLRPG